MKKIIYITLILLCNMGIAKAQNRGNYLEPIRENYDFQREYNAKVRKVLFKGLSDSSEIRFQVMPSFTPENILVIEFNRTNNKYYIIYHICEQKIWYNKDWENIKVKKFKSEIDKESVDLIKSLFGTTIAQIRFPTEKDNMIVGCDGTNYYFSIGEDGLLKSGTVWSPNKGTKMDKLVAIGYKLIELAKSNKKKVKIDAKLKKEIEDLINELKK